MVDVASSVVTVLVFILLTLSILAVYFIARLKIKALNAGSFNVAYREKPEDTWVAGVCHYAEDLLKWYRLFSLKWGSSVRWTRQDFEILNSEVREADGETLAILHCRAGQAKHGQIEPPADFYLAMGVHDYSGLVSWMESVPPQAAEVF